MGFFTKKPVYVPKTGAIALSRDHFVMTARTQPFYGRYSRVVGLARAREALTNAYTENLRGMKATGFWQYGSTENYGNPQILKFADDQSYGVFLSSLEMLFDFDIRKINERGIYCNGMKGKADAGLLLTDLQANTEPEGNYYQAPAPHAPKPGAPAVPPKPAALVNQAKGLAWVTHGVQGDKAAFQRTLLQLTKTDGSFPLGADLTILLNAWNATVPLAPAYRGWNSAASMQKYSSNTGGKKVLEEIITGLSTSPMPARGNNAWYGLALYVLGAITSTQAFTDGNKRMSRLAYILMLLSGGVDIIVPNDALGARLADMR